MADPLKRYEKLGLRDSLRRAYQYPIACRELSIILRGAYSKVPKNLQSLIFEDTITAFHLLPEMQTETAVSAAYTLLQSAESVLPKQKRVLAVSEFKHAKIAHKRRSKISCDSVIGVTQLPQDVLVHVFSFLDVRSLISAALVSRSWNSAASDNSLWHLQYNVFFAGSGNKLKSGWSEIGSHSESNRVQLIEDLNTGSGIDWRNVFKKAFEEAFEGNSAKKFRSYRAYCLICDSVVWLSNMRCPQGHDGQNFKSQFLKPISTQQIVVYILESYQVIYRDDDNTYDSESDEEDSVYKLWAFQRYLA